MKKRTKIALGALTVSGILMSIYGIVQGSRNLVNIIDADVDDDINLPTVEDGDV